MKNNVMKYYKKNILVFFILKFRSLKSGGITTGGIEPFAHGLYICIYLHTIYFYIKIMNLTLEWLNKNMRVHSNKSNKSCKNNWSLIYTEKRNINKYYVKFVYKSDIESVFFKFFSDVEKSVLFF